jgi:hypothetical protein
MAGVHVLPGIERRDLLGVLPPEQLLQKAIENGVTDVVIVGRARDGSPYVASCVADADKAVGQLMRAVTFISGSEITNDQVLNTDEGPAA